MPVRDGRSRPGGTWRDRRGWPLIAAVVVAAASTPSAADPAGGTNVLAESGAPEEMLTLEGLETRLLEAPALRFICELHAEGAIEVDLEGEVTLGPSGKARMELNGAFAGEEMDLLLVSTGEHLAARAGDEVHDARTPPALREAIVLGLVRMGILHNVARLTQAMPPDHADTGIGDWLRTDDVTSTEATTSRGEPAVALSFDLWVSDARAATATLYLSPTTGLPLERTQTVTFATGEFRVVERFTDFELDPEVAPETFAIAG